MLGATQIVGLLGALGASIGLPDQVAPGGEGRGLMAEAGARLCRSPKVSIMFSSGVRG
jgi:hypothetical protein